MTLQLTDSTDLVQDDLRAWLLELPKGAQREIVSNLYRAYKTAYMVAYNGETPFVR